MTPHVSLCTNPLNLTPAQQMLLRVVLTTRPIRTILHKRRMHEVLSHSTALRRIRPWFESDGTPSDSVSYWVPFGNGHVAPARTIRRKPTFSSPMWRGEPRPRGAIRRPLRTDFPNAGFLKELVQELGYNKEAAMAAVVRQPLSVRFQRSDRKRNGVEFTDEGVYYPNTPMRDTRTGGGHKAKSVVEVIAQHRWNDPLSFAVFRVVCQRQKASAVAKELSVNLGTLYTYSSMIRDELREWPQAA